MRYTAFFMVLFCLVAFNFQVKAQQIAIDCEQTWLIDTYFSKEKKTLSQFTKVKELTLRGEYAEAKEIIADLQVNPSDPICLVAAWIYEANILFNESDFAGSISLCDAAVGMLEKKDPDNRYLVKALNLKGKGHGALNDYEQANATVRRAAVLARRIKDDYGLATSFYYFGTFYSDKGDYTACLEYLKKSVFLRRKIGDDLGLAGCYSFMGLCYSHLDNYVKGIDYIQRSITIRERLKDKRGLANSYLTLYKVYSEIGELEKAMDSEFKSLSICEEIKDLQCVSGRYTNIGQLYQKKGEYDKALEFHFKALRLSKQLNIPNRTALVHENIARVYSFTSRFEDGLKHLDSSQVLRESFGDREGIANLHLVRAFIQIEQKQADAAVRSCLIAMETGKSLKLSYVVKEAHRLLSQAYALTKNHEQAYAHYRDYIVLRDSILNIDQSKEIVRKELEFNFNKKQEMQRLIEERKAEKRQAESQRQSNIIFYVSLATVVLSVLLGFSIYQYRLKNKSQKELQKANEELFMTNTELEEKSRIIEQQHDTIREKNNEITDSIRYAHQIQSAMLPTEEEFVTHFRDAFVLFEPKDIISGDFYWVSAHGNKIIYATVDCTGHGVPGGFMSMLGLSLLNELVNEDQLTDPSMILDRLREKVITSLKQKGIDGEQKDGMDMTLCLLDKEVNKLWVAAANHVLYVVRQGEELIEIKGDKHPVGIQGDELKPFTTREIQLQKGDMIYSFTDGYPDQFGGPKGKKFKYIQLKEALQEMSPLQASEQRNVLSDTFTAWKGSLDQVDDVCVIGVRV